MGDEVFSVPKVVRREDVKAYADASGDQNPLHQDDDFARSVGFPGIIAHGMFSMAHLVTALKDWVGDPAASLPCAYRQLATLAHLADAVGFAFHAAGVGDPDPLAAICDALHEWPADELLLLTRGRRMALSHPLDLAHRASRTAGLPVSLARLRAGTVRPAGHRWLPLRSGRCAIKQPHPA